MSTNYVLTAGTSILANIEAGAGLPEVENGNERPTPLQKSIGAVLDAPEDQNAIDFLRSYLDRVDVVGGYRKAADGLATDSDPLHTLEPKIHEIAKAANLERASMQDLFAEAGAIIAYGRREGLGGPALSDVLGPEDTVRLIATDTDIGIAAAALTGWLLAKKVTVKRVTDDTGHQLMGRPTDLDEGPGPARRAEVVVVKSLQANDFGRFKESRAHLGRALADSMTTMPNKVLLSGGFKAVTPIVVACCEFLNEANDLSVGINFEESKQLLDIELRRAPTGWRQALSQRDPYHALAGWAYVGQELTGFGEALQGLITGPEGRA